MTNMKSLHIFQNYVIIEKRNSKGRFENVKSQSSPWNYIYVTFSFVRRVETSLLILLVDRSMRVDYSPHFL
jgi:hypothetical protein